MRKMIMVAAIALVPSSAFAQIGLGGIYCVIPAGRGGCEEWSTSGRYGADQAQSGSQNYSITGQTGSVPDPGTPIGGGEGVTVGNGDGGYGDGTY